jgi:hypothetical protein
MPLLRSTRALLCSAIVIVAACSSITEVPDARDVEDPTLDFNSAQLRWAATHASSYGFDVIVQTAMVPSAGFHHVDVQNGRVVSVVSYSTGERVAVSNGFTIDALWERLNAAKRQGELSQLRFSTDGVPLEAMTGSYANDSGTHYELRNFVRVSGP